MQGFIELYRALDATLYGYAALGVPVLATLCCRGFALPAQSLAALNRLAPALAAHG